MARSSLITRPLVLLAALTMFSGCGLAGFPEFGAGDASGPDAGGPTVFGSPADDASSTTSDDEFGVAVSSLAHSKIIDRGEVKTGDPNDNGRLDKGERSGCEPEFQPKHKNACSEDIELRYRVCLIEEDQFDYSLQVSRDLLDREMCGDWITDLTCTGTEYVQGETACVDGPYCDAVMEGIWEPMVCGWKIVEFAAYTESGELLEEFTQEAVEELGFELLEVPATVQ